MKRLTTADVDDIKAILICNIANKSVQHNNNQCYGIDCGEDLPEQIDKSSAYLWALNSECTINFICEIVDFANSIQFVTDICNPEVKCSSTIINNCIISAIDLGTGEILCTLPSNTITIIR